MKLFTDKFINLNEQFPLALFNKKLILRVGVTRLETLKVDTTAATYGQFTEDTAFKSDAPKPLNKGAAPIKIQKNENEVKEIFNEDVSFQSLGIGGLDDQFVTIFRRAFNSRRYPASVIEKYGVKHCKGMLLHGPPGTGKTLIARQIAKALNCSEPIVVNGPQIFDKFVGGSEKKIRELFEPAEKELAEKGDESGLHIIIFDEIDAICRERGSGSNSGTNVNDSVVNQLLTKIDGVEALPNILLIGMTNRIDMIDKAILRPGRLELHLEIGLPGEHGRKQIFEIHTRSMKKNNLLGSDVSIDELAKMTKNYTGAEIEAVCGLACSYALFGHDNAEGVAKKIKEERKKGAKFEEKQVTRSEFMQALTEIKPDFGVDDVALERQFLGGIYNYSDQFTNVYEHCEDLVHSMHNTTSANPLLSIILEGDSGSGKTALAAKIAVDSGFPFVKLISPEMFVGQPDFVKVQKITKIF